MNKTRIHYCKHKEPNAYYSLNKDIRCKDCGRQVQTKQMVIDLGNSNTGPLGMTIHCALPEAWSDARVHKFMTDTIEKWADETHITIGEVEITAEYQPPVHITTFLNLGAISKNDLFHS